MCTSRHCDSEDPDKCPCRGDTFRPDWMNMRIRKHNADHGVSPKKPLNFLPPPPTAPTITKSLPQSNEANAQYKTDGNALTIAVTNDNDNFEGNFIGDEVTQQDTQSDMQSESLLTEVDNHGEECLFCGKSSIQTTENIYENYNVSKCDAAFGLTPTVSEDSKHNKSNLHSFVASYAQASHYSIRNAPKSSPMEPKSIVVYADGGSNVVLVASPSFLYDFYQNHE